MFGWLLCWWNEPDELRDHSEKDILLATYSMASEGMDVPKLNTVILASPKSDVEQSVGRVFRQKHVIKISSINNRYSR